MFTLLYLLGRKNSSFSDDNLTITLKNNYQFYLKVYHTPVGSSGSVHVINLAPKQTVKVNKDSNGNLFFPGSEIFVPDFVVKAALGKNVDGIEFGKLPQQNKEPPGKKLKNPLTFINLFNHQMKVHLRRNNTDIKLVTIPAATSQNPYPEATVDQPLFTGDRLHIVRELALYEVELTDTSLQLLKLGGYYMY